MLLKLSLEYYRCFALSKGLQVVREDTQYYLWYR